MNPIPSFLICSGIGLWLWQQGWLWLAPLLWLPFVLQRFIKFRWHLQDHDIYRLVDSCTLMMVGIAIYSIVMLSTVEIILNIIRFMPLVLYPVIFITLYSNYKVIPLTALSMKARKKRRANRNIQIDYPFMISCLIGASIGNQYPWLFYVVQSLLIFSLILCHTPIRLKSRATLQYIALLLPALALGFMLNTQLAQWQAFIEQKTPDWLMSWLFDNHDPFEQNTSLGHVGELKLSNEIVMRVERTDGITQFDKPLLLKKNVFEYFDGRNWHTQYKLFFDIVPSSFQHWEMDVSNTQQKMQSAHIYFTPNYKQTLIPTPIGLRSLSDLQALELSKTEMGVIKASEVLDKLSYNVLFTDESGAQPSLHTDLTLPAHLQPVLAQIFTEIGFDTNRPETLIPKLQQLFEQKFRYSLRLDNDDRSPIKAFLSHNRRGHCEYFATATVLLLRAAGIPARYVSGYSVQEFSQTEQRYLVRKLHGHAWAMAYLDGHWRNVDLTPPDWGEIDENRFNALWQQIKDYLSWLWFEFSQLTHKDWLGVSQKYWLLLAFVGAVYLIRRLRVRKWKTESQRVSQSFDFDRVESPAQAVYEYLSELAGQRDLTFRQLMHQLSWQDDELLQQILQGHEQCLYDPAQQTQTQREQLAALAQTWLDQVTPLKTQQSRF